MVTMEKHSFTVFLMAQFGIKMDIADKSMVGSVHIGKFGKKWARKA